MSWPRIWGIKEDWEKIIPEKLRKLNEKYYKPYGAILGRVPKKRKNIRKDLA